jgi:glycosyltransferase involved in cell wall biosynthesis
VLPAEVILIDDASGDSTLTLLQTLATQNPTCVKVLTLAENQGPASARNAGWAAASQPLIAFLDSDDAWHPEKIRIQYEFMKCHPQIALSAHNIALKDHGGWDLRTLSSSQEPRIIGRVDLLVKNRFATSTVMLKRDIAQRFVERKRYSEDYDLWLQIVFNGLPAAVIPSQLTFRFNEFYGDSGLSAQLWKMQKGQLNSLFHLYQTKKINMMSFSLVGLYSLLKYLARTVVVFRRRR